MCSPFKRLCAFTLTLVCILWVSASAGDSSSSPARNLASEITVEDAYINVPLPGKSTTAAFFTLHNRSTSDIALVAVSTDIATRAELHSHSFKDGVMRMRREDRVVVPARGSLAFESGSWHVMLFDVTKTLKTGEQLHLTLTFSDGTSLPIVVQIRSLFDKPHH